MLFIRNMRGIAATVLPLALVPLPAWAEGAEGGEKAGLPQFDVTLFPEQIFWLVVSFATLYLLMAFIALPRVARTQGNRRSVITKEIETAREANETAKASVISTEKALSEARAKAQASVSEMLAKVAEEANEHRVSREKDLLRKLRRSEEGIATARAAALEQVHAAAEGLAESIVEKILGAKKRVKA